jgi:hypothetical protein
MSIRIFLSYMILLFVYLLKYAFIIGTDIYYGVIIDMLINPYIHFVNFFIQSLPLILTIFFSFCLHKLCKKYKAILKSC